ncbi:MAG: hypothetical protein HY815_25375 [Candidatus Riflebacteria bacterium]|nr:hypothetical protein [Candidatus Riflebacteria bacterium]
MGSRVTAPGILASSGASRKLESVHPFDRDSSLLLADQVVRMSTVDLDHAGSVNRYIARPSGCRLLTDDRSRQGRTFGSGLEPTRGLVWES